MNLGQLISLGFATTQDLWSWLLMLSMVAKVASTLALLGLKAGRPWRWVASHERGLWWTTKFSALAICVCATLLCRAGGDVGGAVFFAALLLVAAVLVATRAAGRQAQP